MTDIYADVILFDSIGSPYDGNTMHKCGMGGSEFQAILLLEELAKEGYKVICLNNSNKESFVNGVLNVYLFLLSSNSSSVTNFSI